MTYISTQSLSAPMRTSVMQAQTALAQVQSEISSGNVANLGLTLGANTGTDLSLKTEIDALGGFTSSNSGVATRLSATATTLTAMVSSAQSLQAALISAQSTGSDTTALAGSAASALKSLIAGLNTTVAGQSIFGGINTTQVPIASYTDGAASKQAVDAAFSQAFGSSQTSSAAASVDGDDMTSFLGGQFASLFTGASWQADWSSASDTTVQSAVSPTQTLSTSVSANNTAFQQLAQAYTMVSKFTNSNLSDSARAAVISQASTLMASGLSALVGVQSSVGTAQAAVSNANAQISAQTSVLKNNVSDFESVDTYSLSSRLTNLQTQLEASYELTSRLQSLSLTNYLTTG